MAETDVVEAQRSEPTEFELELERARAEHAEWLRIEARVADADRLEQELALERSGIPDGTLRQQFVERLYSGPPDPRSMRLAWAALVDDTSWLDRDEQIEFEFKMRRARAARGRT